MIPYLLKVIACSAFFLAVYYVMLEKAKMARFNRFYLIISLIASLIIPAITFTSEITVFPAVEEIQEGAITFDESRVIATGNLKNASVNWSSILLITYLAVVFLLLLRFVINLYRILSLAKRNKRISFPWYSLVLLKKPTIPFSFFRFIFIGEEDYLERRTEPEVLHHELCHVEQYHSIDIMFIELLSVFVWFNPLVFLYRRAVQLNHEFLADDAVVLQFGDPVGYQLLLLEKVCPGSSGYSVTSPFNYKITQKRLTMITHYSSDRHKVIRFLALVPITAAAILFFSERLIAQVAAMPAEEVEFNVKTASNDTIPDKPKDGSVKSWGKLPQDKFIGGTEAGISSAELKEYKELIEKSRWSDKKGNVWTSTPSLEKRPRMQELFSKMSRLQQSQQEIVFVYPPRPMTKNVPTEAQLENFKDASKYGIWVDLKRIDNALLSDYKPTDFSQFTITKLSATARQGRSYTHQLNLSTNSFFEKENERRRSIKDPVAIHSITREAIK
jgi:bla regulator protein blaR1